MRGQAATENLVLYAFVLAVVVIVSIIVYTAYPVKWCSSNQKLATGFSQFKILDFILTGSNSNNPNQFYVVLQSKTNFAVNITRVKLYMQGVLCGSASIPSNLSISTANLTIITLGGNLSSNCQQVNGGCYTASLEVDYNASGVQLSDNGVLNGVYEDMHATFIQLPWYSTNYSNGSSWSYLTEENNEPIGSFQGVCPAAPPVFSNNFSIVNSNNTYLIWSIPPGCSNTSVLTGNGFNSTYCNQTLVQENDIPYLAHGWLFSQVYVSSIFSNHTLYLGGEGVYNNSGVLEPNYICVNDNFYFYVNNQLVYMGGTSGVINQSLYRTCIGCNLSDGWCIPPVALSNTSAFKFNQNNQIAVLLEDYCNGGGVKIFNLFFA
jgi:hypothetical protein